MGKTYNNQNSSTTTTFLIIVIKKGKKTKDKGLLITSNIEKLSSFIINGIVGLYYINFSQG